MDISVINAILGSFEALIRNTKTSFSTLIFVLGCFIDYKDINGTVNYSLADDTKNFIEKKVNFDICIYNVTGVSFYLNKIF